jgi:branched-chain amino acid transport system ATP-binding protein
MLSVNNLNVVYGKMHVLRDVCIEVPEHAFIAVIGANGAGKSTLLRAISGLASIASGAIKFNGSILENLTARQICELGIIQVPEGRKIFPLMKVKENLQLGAYLPKPRKQIKETLKQVYELFPILKERENQLAKTLSGGEQQMLAIGRGLMSRPSLLILDEPTMSLSPKLSTDILLTLKKLNDQGITILLVSQEVIQSLNLVNRAYVLENGRIVLHGTKEELSSNEHVRKAYLGL